METMIAVTTLTKWSLAQLALVLWIISSVLEENASPTTGDATETRIAKMARMKTAKLKRKMEDFSTRLAMLHTSSKSYFDFARESKHYL